MFALVSRRVSTPHLVYLCSGTLLELVASNQVHCTDLLPLFSATHLLSAMLSSASVAASSPRDHKGGKRNRPYRSGIPLHKRNHTVYMFQMHDLQILHLVVPSALGLTGSHVQNQDQYPHHVGHS